MRTSTPKPPAPKWFLVDAEGANLGRLAAWAASVLRGKHRPTYSPHMLCGDHVIVMNAAKLAIPPGKFRRKEYHRHTGYLGHLRTVSLERLLTEKPTELIERAVKGMLPKNTLRKEMLKRLHVYADATHMHDAQKPVPYTLAS